MTHDDLPNNLDCLPFRNPDLPLAERVADLVARLTFDEKVSLLGETAPDIERLGIRRYYHGNEALHGIVRPGKFTVFPRPPGLASTFHPELIEQMADCASDESRARYNEFGGDMVGESLGGKYNGLLTFWSPTVNMARDPRWGRTSETYGEDPCLTAAMGAAFVRGLQGDHPEYLKAVATPKHFAANNEEHNRFSCDARIPERCLREYYLPGFRGCVVEGGAESIMTAYNAIDGVPCTVSRMLLTDILRDEWGFDGYVVGDMWSPGFVMEMHHYTETWEETAAACLDAGLDLDSGFKPYPHLRSTVEQGLCTEGDVDGAVGRVLRARFRLGMFDPDERVPFNRISTDVIGCDRHHDLSLRLARESMVLLKNEPVGDGTPLLPLDPAKVRSIAVFGPSMHTWRQRQYSAEGGSVRPPVTPLAGIEAVAGDITVRHMSWDECSAADSRKLTIPAERLRPAAAGEGGEGLTGEYFRNAALEGEPAAVRTDPQVSFDRTGQAPDPLFSTPPVSVRWTGQLVPPIDGEYEICLTADGGVRMWLGGEQVVDAWEDQDGATEHTVWAEFRAGEPVDVKIEYTNTGSEAAARLAWVVPRANVEPDEHDPAYRLACDSDVVVAFMGLAEDDAGEGNDRPQLGLPGGQTDFLKWIHKANANIVLVLINGAPVVIPWEKEHVPAILEAWLPGEHTGRAIAEVLLGDLNPAGRLPLTFYDGVEQLPPFDDYDVTKGRTYLYLREKPLFAFGHGLSYTTFEYDRLTCPAEVAATDLITVSVDVRNTGGRDGDEVVQLYVRNVESPVVQPIRQLKGFRRVSVAAGETATVEIPLAIADLAHWDEESHGWLVEPGEFEIQIGAASDDIRLTRTIVVR